MISSAIWATSPDLTLVKTDRGLIRGVVTDKIRSFQGIPYVAAPLGNLRYHLPEPHIAWTHVLTTTTPNKGCPQLSRYGGLTEASENEDCLYLNVVTPFHPGKSLPKNLPIMVWIHGGAFVGGSASYYPLEQLAISGQAMLVSFNYRLGVLGFLAHPSLDRNWNGDLGIKDMQAALAWVQKNARAFGGDPKNVTIFGESAGAGLVCMLLISPNESSGLFQKAAISSAACVRQFREAKDSEKVGLKIAEQVGCTDNSKALSCLRSKSVKELLDAGSKAAGDDLMAFTPTVGNKTLPLQGKEALQSGKFVRVPLINGGNKDEFRLYIGYMLIAGKKINAENYIETLTSYYGDHAEAVSREYSLKDYSSAAIALATALSDYNPVAGIYNCGYLQQGRLAAKYVSVYEYVFSDENSPPLAHVPNYNLGAAHAQDLSYLFPRYDDTNAHNGSLLTGDSLTISDKMIGYWTTFAKTGNPNNAKQKPYWPEFKKTSDVMNFLPGKIRTFDAAKAHHCDFWEKYYQ